MSPQMTQKAVELESNGFVMFPGFFSKEEAVTAWQELESWYQRDLEERKAKGHSGDHFDGVAGHTILTSPSHLIQNAYLRSPTLDRMVEKILTDSQTKPVLEALAGKYIKIRGYNVRRMTGSFDPPPAHEWHRDSKGECGIGILLTDVGPKEHAATAFVPESHLWPFDPRWDGLFSTPYTGWHKFLKYNIFNKLLKKRTLKNATGGHGNKGDFYFFINDIWHGRQPNLHGSQSMVILIGFFPTAVDFPDRVKIPSSEVLEKLPPHLASAARQDGPKDDISHTILARMWKARPQAGFISLWRFAKMERKFADSFSKVEAFRIIGYKLSGIRKRLFPISASR